MRDTARQLEVCQEARFVLWALRCAVARHDDDREAAAEISRGFELADVSETSLAFWEFAEALRSIVWAETVWHDPRCCCVSTEEVFLLQALAETSERLRQSEVQPAQWWRVLIPAKSIAIVDRMARAWLDALDRAGVVFPLRGELVDSLRPLENMMTPAGSLRLN